MPEWWTYRLSDFLMFTPGTYYRLFERQNEALWPLQLFTLALGVVLTGTAWRVAGRRQVLPGLLAMVWVFVAWAFHWQRYAPINLAAKWFAAAFVLEALLLAGWAARMAASQTAAPRRRGGLVMSLLGLVLLPLIGPLLGRSWAAVELFGLAPDPTATVTLGLLLMTGAPAPLLVIPLLWCVASWATLWAMDAGDAWVILGAGLLAAGSVVGRKVRSARQGSRTG